MWTGKLAHAAAKGTRSHNLSGRTIGKMMSTRSSDEVRVNSMGTHFTESSGFNDSSGSLNAKRETPTAPRTWNDIIRDTQKSKAWSCLTIICTMWVLGGDDVYLLTDPPLWLDRPIFSLYLVCSFNFVADLLMRTSFEEGYPWSCSCFFLCIRTALTAGVCLCLCMLDNHNHAPHPPLYLSP